MRRCEHGVYWPEGHTKAFSCQFCNPEILNEPPVPFAEIPKFNRRGSLNITETGCLPKCPVCEGTSILTVSNGGKCAICKTEFDLESPEHLRANNKQPGVCPACGCGIHYETGTPRKWKCADCGEEYKAPKRIQ